MFCILLPCKFPDFYLLKKIILYLLTVISHSVLLINWQFYLLFLVYALNSLNIYEVNAN